MNTLDIKRSNRLPKNFTEILPLKCKGLLDYDDNVVVDCGSTVSVSVGNFELRCESKVCPNRVLLRLKKLFRKLELDMLSNDNLISFIKEGIISPMELFDIDSEIVENLEGLSEEEKQSLVDVLDTTREMPLVDYIWYLSLEGLEDRNKINLLFEGFINTEEFYKELDKNPIDFIENRLSLGRYWLENNIEEITKEVISGNTEYLTKLEKDYGVSKENLLTNTRSCGVEYLRSILGKGKNDRIDFSTLRIFKLLMEHKREILDSEFLVDIIC